jgi:LmbE family N-acetylglucosaminyl deacetylase
MATRAERGWQGEPHANPGPQSLARLRESELRALAEALGLRHIHFLKERDGELDRAAAAGVGEFCRVNAGRAVEDDLFVGLR